MHILFHVASSELESETITYSLSNQMNFSIRFSVKAST